MSPTRTATRAFGAILKCAASLACMALGYVAIFHLAPALDRWGAAGEQLANAAGATHQLTNLALKDWRGLVTPTLAQINGAANDLALGTAQYNQYWTKSGEDLNAASGKLPGLFAAGTEALNAWRDAGKETATSLVFVRNSATGALGSVPPTLYQYQLVAAAMRDDLRDPNVIGGFGYFNATMHNVSSTSADFAAMSALGRKRFEQAMKPGNLVLRGLGFAAPPALRSTFDKLLGVGK